MRSEGSEIIQGIAHCHPRIKRDGIRHIGQTRLHIDFILLGIDAEDLDGTRLWPKQVQQALDSSRLARAIPAKEAVATTSADGEVEVMNRLMLAVAPGQPADLNCWDAHSILLGVVFEELSA